MSKINEKLSLFVQEGAVWDALKNLQNCNNTTRFGAYCSLIELVKSGNTDALDIAADTGQALYLANELVGSKVFQATMAEAIGQAVRIDMEDKDITESDGKIVQKLLSVSFS